jgi:hypothetical protein
MEKTVEACEACQEDFCGDGSHEIKGEVICFTCYEEIMDDALFGDPFGEW